MMTKLKNGGRLLKGKLPLPAGAIPLAVDGVELICLMPNGRWVGWVGGSIKNKPTTTSKQVVKLLVNELGGAESAANELGVSKRTLEGWSQGRPIPIAAAYRVAESLV